MPARQLENSKMKSSTKLLISGFITGMTVILAGELFDAIGVLYGPAQAGLSGLAGLVGSVRLFSGS
jgi:hypothetical protein